MMIVGGGGWSARAATDIVGFAEANDIPTGVAFRCQDLFDNDHANYAGDIGIGLNPPLARRIRECDLLLVVGARLGEITTQGYTLPAPPNAPQTLVHVHADAGELGRVYQADLPIASGMAEFAAAARALDPVDAAARRDWAKAARDDYLAGLEPGPTPGPIDMALIIAALSARVAPDAIITNDAGNFSGWAQRFYRFTRYRSQLGPTNGAMGYGVPAAVAAKAACPDRTVICFVGDGGMLMTGQEIATALQHGIAPVIIVVNNDMYGTIRMHQERDYPARVHMARRSPTPTSRRWPGPMAPMARRSRRPRTSRRRSTARSPPDAAPSSNCASTPRRSPRARRSARSAKRRWRHTAAE